MKINSHKELRVWQEAMDVAMEIFQFTKSFPPEEKYSLTDQIRRSSRSVATNISEAWRKRRYEAAFVSKLSDAESEACETQTWIEFSLRCEYLRTIAASKLDAAYEKIISQLVNMIHNKHDWILSPRPKLPALPVARSPGHLVRTAKMVALFCIAALMTKAYAGDWPQWRGEKRDGHASVGSPPVTSLPKELKPVWKIAVGPAFSAPVIVNGKLLYLDEQNGQEVAHVVAAATGKELWNAPFAKSEGDEWGTGPRSAPFIDGDRAYAQSVNGEFRCFNLADGKVLWGVSFPNYGVKFVGSKAGEGTAARRGNNGSGLVDGHFVYVPVGAKGASIVCFDKLTGKEIWKALDDEAAYSSFLVATLAGVKQLVGLTADALVGVDLKSGKELWRAPFKTQAKRHAASPVIVGADTVTVNSFTFGIACVKITKEGGELKPSELWINKQQKIHLSTPTFVDGFLYSQGANQSGDFVCIDASNGQVKWAQPGYGKDQKDMTSIIANGKNLLVLTYSGQLVLVEANPEKYVELGRVPVCGNTWSYPAFADGKLYVRDNRELQCLDLVAKQVAAR